MRKSSREWSDEVLKEYADKWMVCKEGPKSYIKLLTQEEFKKLRKGTKLFDIKGKEYTKGVDTVDPEDSMWLFGRMPYGLELFQDAPATPVVPAKKGKK